MAVMIADYDMHDEACLRKSVVAVVGVDSCQDGCSCEFGSLCNYCSGLVLDINCCGLWGKSIELKEYLFQALCLWVLFGGFSGRGKKN